MSFPILILDEIDSTNSEAMRRAAAGESGPVWFMARRQTAGRGRSGRSWQSSEGNLAATLLISPGCAIADLHQVSFVAGIALIDGVEAVSGRARRTLHLRLKWPNDLLAGSAKLGGSLIESTSRGAVAVAAIGIGVNVADAPAIGGRDTTSLRALDARADAHELLAGISAAMSRWLDIWDAGRGFPAIRAAWLERAGPIGERITVNTGSEVIRGVFAGIDETGALLVDSVPPKTGEMRRVTFGDVSLAAAGDGIGQE